MKLFYVSLLLLTHRTYHKAFRVRAVASLMFLVFDEGGPCPQPCSLSVLLGLDVTQFRGHFSSAARNPSVCPRGLC